MKIVAQVKLLPASAYEADALVATLRAANRAANHVSRVAFETGTKTRNELQKAVYLDLKASFDLSAQPAVRVVKKVVDAYATFKGNIRGGHLTGKARRKAESKSIVFRENAAQPFDDRCLSWNLDARTVSIWTVAGRLKGIGFVCSPEAMKLLASRKGESDRKRLRATVAKLQAKRTKSAKRALKRLRRREARFATDANHCISKRIVQTAERTSRGIALEDLKGIRQRVTAKKDQRYPLHSWAFAQLGAFVEYKARRVGVPVVHVDPRNTSRQCSECWHAHRRNRVSQAWFACRSCGSVMHADHGGTSRPKAGRGSRNIAHRADAAWQRGKVNCPSTA